MGKLIDLTGQRFGRLTVIKRTEEIATNKSAKWHCVCDCGNYCIKTSSSLRRFEKNSCGCWKSEITSKLFKKYYNLDRKLYEIWKGIKARCFNINSKDYRNYGGRGITICDEWLDYNVFSNWAIYNKYINGLTIERIDVNGNYCPENCCWIENKYQGQNTRKVKRFIYNEKSYTIRQLSENFNVNYYALKARLTQYGWDIEMAINELVSKGRNQYAIKRLSNGSNS